jgi:hypothetical protein
MELESDLYRYKGSHMTFFTFSTVTVTKHHSWQPHRIRWRLAIIISEEGYSSSIGENISDVNLIISFLQQLIDDDRLSDLCCNSEVRVVGKREI